MFTKGTFVLAIIIGTASGALAASTQHSTAPNHDVYDARACTSARIRTRTFEDQLAAIIDPDHHEVSRHRVLGRWPVAATGYRA
jgi:hypothetical protein